MHSTTHRMIINLLLEHGALSRADLARLTRLNRATISAIVSELLDEQVLREVGIGDSTGGRKPVLLRLGGNQRLIVGIGLERTRCIAVVVNLDGQVMERAEWDVAAPDAERAAAMLVAGIERLFANRPVGTLLGCGVALSGLIDAARGLVYSTGLHWEGVPFQSMLEQSLSVPVFVIDNAHAAGLGELWLRGRELRQNLVYLYLGKGVGGAVVIDRDLYLGRNHAAGEFGPMCLDIDGPLFPCGHRGCLEGFTSEAHLLDQVEAARAVGMTSELLNDLPGDRVVVALGQAAVAGDGVALAIMRQTARYVGAAAANLISTLNPDEIIIGGPLAAWGERFAELVAAEARQWAVPIPFESVRMLPGEAESETVPLGSAAMVIRQAADLLAPR